MTHPLTDDLAEDISTEVNWLTDISDVVFTYNDMRAAYDLAIEHVYQIWNQLCEEEEPDSTVCWKFSRELGKMRPQQQEE